MKRFQAIANGEEPYQGDLISDEMRERVKAAVNASIWISPRLLATTTPTLPPGLSASVGIQRIISATTGSG